MLAVILMHELFDEMQPLRPVINKYIGKQQQDYLQTMYNIVTLGLAHTHQTTGTAETLSLMMETRFCQYSVAQEFYTWDLIWIGDEMASNFFFSSYIFSSLIKIWLNGFYFTTWTWLLVTFPYLSCVTKDPMCTIPGSQPCWPQV